MNACSDSSQLKNLSTLHNKKASLSRIPTFPTKTFVLQSRKPRGRPGAQNLKVSSHISAFSTNFKTSSFDTKSTTTSQPPALLIPRNPTSSIVVGNDAEHWQRPIEICVIRTVTYFGCTDISSRSSLDVTSLIASSRYIESL